MAIASLILGIVSIIGSFVPVIGGIATVPAIIGLIFGIIDLIQRNRNKTAGKGLAIAGIVLSSMALIIILFWLISVGIAFLIR